MTDEIKNKLTERFNSAYGEEVKIGLREALRKVYLGGAEHGYQYAVEKACEWLESLSGYVVCGQKANVENFRKAMEL